VNEAALTVPAVAGNVTPPVVVRVPAGAKTAVPRVDETATFPKLMSVAFTIEIGATTVAVVGAEAVTCAEAFDEKPTHRVIIEIIRVIFFIIEKDLGLIIR